MDADLRREIEELRKLTTKQLQKRYRDWFGEENPSSNRDHLFRRIAWRMQARTEGGLNQRVQEQARCLADVGHLRLRAPREFWKELETPQRPPRRDPRLPVPGTILCRNYRGQQIVVTVRDQGFEYQGKQYAALSSIAYAITGTRWNGFVFFGLKGACRP